MTTVERNEGRSFTQTRFRDMIPKEREKWWAIGKSMMSVFADPHDRLRFSRCASEEPLPMRMPLFSSTAPALLFYHKHLFGFSLENCGDWANRKIGRGQRVGFQRLLRLCFKARRRLDGWRGTTVVSCRWFLSWQNCRWVTRETVTVKIRVSPFPWGSGNSVSASRITPCMHTGTKRLVCNNAHDPVHSISLAICQPTASHHGLESLSKGEHVESSQSRSS